MKHFFTTVLSGKIFSFLLSGFLLAQVSSGQTLPAVAKAKPPLMGWASWNQFGVNISENVIKSQADAMVSAGLFAAGFKYVNIDDGFFNGRNADGSLKINAVKFPNGMKYLADYIHTKGLKAGFYSEAGANTCGSVYSGQPGGVGGGMYGHDQQDADLFFKTWGFDFLKVDYCGGREQKLDEKTRYTAIKNAIVNTGREVNYNVCRWQFPGTWVTSLADSWRMSTDINFVPGSKPTWSSIVNIINLNKYNAPYASPGHYNDMDMLEVGRGLSFEEDKSHFSMWCILSSPLLLGCDMTKMSGQTKSLLTNPEVIAVNQDTTGSSPQGILLSEKNGLQVWVKKLNGRQSSERAVVFFNLNTAPAVMSVKWKDLNLIGPVTVRDLWARTLLGSADSMYSATVPAHGVLMLKVTGTKAILQETFEGEYAWLNNYNLTQNTGVVANQGRAVTDALCSGGAKASYVGNREDNFIEFKDVYANVAGKYKLTLTFQSGENRNATMRINGKDTLLTNLNSGGFSTLKNISYNIQLNQGYNSIRFSNTTGWIPDIDKIHIDLNKYNSNLILNLVSPVNNSIFPAGNNISLSANASAIGGIRDVKFYNGTKLLATDNSAPYSFAWSNVAAGTYTIRAVAADNHGNTSEVVAAIKVVLPQGPYDGTIHQIPGIIQAEHFDVGGNGIAYSDDSPGSEVTPAVLFRTDEDVDIEVCKDEGGGYNIGYAKAGEWLEYSVNVNATDNYDLSLRIAANGEGKSMHLEMDGKNISGAIALPNTSGWQTWQTMEVKNLSLVSGKHVMRLAFDSDYFNINYLKFESAVITSISDQNSEPFSESNFVYPNPFEAAFTINLESEYNYQLSDMTGREIEKGTAMGSLTLGGNLKPGIYFLQISNGHGQKIIKLLK